MGMSSVVAIEPSGSARVRLAFVLSVLFEVS